MKKIIIKEPADYIGTLISNVNCIQINESDMFKGNEIIISDNELEKRLMVLFSDPKFSNVIEIIISNKLYNHIIKNNIFDITKIGTISKYTSTIKITRELK